MRRLGRQEGRDTWRDREDYVDFGGVLRRLRGGVRKGLGGSEKDYGNPYPRVWIRVSIIRTPNKE